MRPELGRPSIMLLQSSGVRARFHAPQRCGPQRRPFTGPHGGNMWERLPGVHTKAESCRFLPQTQAVTSSSSGTGAFDSIRPSDEECTRRAPPEQALHGVRPGRFPPSDGYDLRDAPRDGDEQTEHALGGTLPAPPVASTDVVAAPPPSEVGTARGVVRRLDGQCHATGARKSILTQFNCSNRYSHPWVTRVPISSGIPAPRVDLVFDYFRWYPNYL